MSTVDCHSPSHEIYFLGLRINVSTRVGKFTINRNAPTCCTPRRNDDIIRALAGMVQVASWASQCHSYFWATLFPIESGHGIDLQAVQSGSPFVPVIPLFEKCMAFLFSF